MEVLDIRQLIGEATEYDKKVALEVKKPKSWCKSVSAFANGMGGRLIWGIADDDTLVGLADAKGDAEKISEAIKVHIDPIPEFNLSFAKAEDKEFVVLTVMPGAQTPYYYIGDGQMQAFVRVGNESVVASMSKHKELVLKGSNMSYDSLVSLLQAGLDFVRRNTRKAWRKTADNRLEYPEYPERAVEEGLVNALIHRNYLELGSEVHIDMYDDRLEIFSPGGLMDGGSIKDMDVMNMASRRRNPILADIFSRLKYMERRGSGFKKIVTAYKSHDGYTEGMDPTFSTPWDSFVLVLPKFDIDGVDGVYVTTDEASVQDGVQGSDQGAQGNGIELNEKQKAVLEFCSVPQSASDILDYINLSQHSKNRKTYVSMLVEAGLLAMTVPDKPNDMRQKYVRTDKPIL